MCRERPFSFLNLVMRLSAGDMKGRFCGLAHDDRFVSQSDEQRTDLRAGCGLG